MQELRGHGRGGRGEEGSLRDAAIRFARRECADAPSGQERGLQAWQGEGEGAPLLVCVFPTPCDTWISPKGGRRMGVAA